MRHYFLVKEYNKEKDFHICLDDEGMEHCIVFNFFDEANLSFFKKEDLVGKKISVSYTEPVVSIGFDVRIE